MAKSHLSAYLNDHLAGSVVALELLAHLEHAHAGTPLAQTLAEVRAEIAADRTALEALMAQVGAGQSAPRQAAAWLSEKLARAKLALDDGGAGSMHLFEGLEAVSLGIEGKAGLWRALERLATADPAVSGPDYAELIRRAERQRGRIEAERLRVAPAALGPTQE